MDIPDDPQIDKKIELLANSQNIDMFLAYFKQALELEVITSNKEMQQNFLENNKDKIQKLYYDALNLFDKVEQKEHAKELLKQYNRFKPLLNDDFKPDPPQENGVSIKTIQEVARFLNEIEDREPMSDYEALYYTFHYAGSTSKRTVGGTIAKSMVESYGDNCIDKDKDMTYQFIRIYEDVNGQAAAREKVLRKKENPIEMKVARKAHLRIKEGQKKYFESIKEDKKCPEVKRRQNPLTQFFSRKTYPEQLSEQLGGKEADQMFRQNYLENYKYFLAMNILPESVTKMTQFLQDGLESYLSKRDFTVNDREKFDEDTCAVYDRAKQIQEELIMVKLNDCEEANIIQGSTIKHVK